MNVPAPAPLTQRAHTRTYPGRPDQARQVRDDLRRFLDGCPIAYDVILCGSELAANAAVHSQSRKTGTITVRAHISPDRHVLIEVHDDGGPWAEPPPDPTRGRGLDIVSALATTWGINQTATGRTVWAQLAWPAT